MKTIGNATRTGAARAVLRTKGYQALTVLIAGATLTAACGDRDEGPSTAAIQSELISAGTTIGQYSIPCEQGQARCQFTDIADVGSDKFVVGYVDASGNLKYTYRSTTAGQMVAPFTKGTKAKWVRANSSKSWKASSCDINYFAVEVTDPQGGHGVYLDTFSYCDVAGSGWSMQRTLVAAQPGFAGNMVPAVATKGSPSWGDLLFVWGSSDFPNPPMYGRIYRFRGSDPSKAGWTSTFQLGTVGGFSSDAIYNQHSNRWIVGAMVEAITESNFTNSNVVLTSSDDALPTQVDGISIGTRADGHHTSVAYNPLSNDGSYVWWLQNGGQLFIDYPKAIYVMNANGKRFEPATAFLTLTADDDPPHTEAGFTVPLGQTYSAAVPYVFPLPSGLYGMTANKTWTLLDQGYLGSTPFAVRSLASETVVVGPGTFPNLSLFTSEWPHVPPVLTTPNYLGEVVAYFGGNTGDDTLFNGWQTSFAGNGQWTNRAAYNVDTSAQQVAAIQDFAGFQTVVYNDQNYVLHWLRESTPASNELFDGGTLGTPKRGKQVAVALNQDATLTVFYTRYTDDVLCFVRQTSYNVNDWTAEAPLAGATTKARRIAVARLPNKALQVVFTDMNDVLRATWQTGSDANSWTTPSTITGTSKARDVTMVTEAGKTYPQIVYAGYSGTTNAIAEAKQSSTGVWTAGVIRTGSAKQIAVAQNQRGHLHVVYVSPDNRAYQIYKTSTGWSASSQLHSSAPTVKRVSVARNVAGDGRLEVFFIGASDFVYHTSQVPSSSQGEGDFYSPSRVN